LGTNAEENGAAEEELREWGRRESKEGLVVAHGALDEVRKYGNVARCDITEDVGLGSGHIQGLCYTHYGFRTSRILKDLN